MNILHISRRFYPCIGGTEKYILGMSRNLIQRGINCKVLTAEYDVLSRKNKFSKHELVDGIEVIRVPVVGHYKKIFPLNIPFNLFRWADIIHIHDLRFFYETVLSLKNIFKYKIVLSTHGLVFHTEDFALLKRVLWKLYYKKTINKCIDSVICSSLHDFEILNEEGNCRIQLIEDGVEIKSFETNTRSYDSGKFVYFGRIDKNKGVDLLFNALSQIANEKWVINMFGLSSNNISVVLKDHSRLSGIDDKIKWHGFVPQEELLRFISNAHICFFPSTAEGFGFSLVEAMANGCICLVNDIAPYRDKIDNCINGFIADFNDPLEVVKTINVISNLSSVKKEEISLNARNKAKRYSWENKINQVIAVYDRLVC
ncbi:MAG: glycosyltransferase family 4 protein [Candidatus Omnitrophica bacterium]|nr:glycosyltransferase family 4 protein [Candidatus Omnitrophota bacterium]